MLNPLSGVLSSRVIHIELLMFYRVVYESFVQDCGDTSYEVLTSYEDYRDMHDISDLINPEAQAGVFVDSRHVDAPWPHGNTPRGSFPDYSHI